ncbi:MAG: SUMF1/EgtB/PvdO family nonheme iron enzyme [Verrucomicrobia bacterium]|nr:SUMF1/EgtB/PvdO family nonheme iron enzyme [Verrucomicrobiota bacterium]
MKNLKLSGVFCLIASCIMFSASQSQGAVGDNIIDKENFLRYTVLTEDGTTGTVEVGSSDWRYTTGDVIIPSSVTKKDEDTGITYTYRVTALRRSAFSGCVNITKVVIPDSVTSIGESAFSSTRNLTTVEIPDSVTSIETAAFYGARGLSSIKVPGSVTVIPFQLFWECYALTDVEIGNGVTTIEESAFYLCESLATLTIPASVTSIADRVFCYCKNLTSVYYEGDVPDAGTYIYSSAPETLVTYYPTGNASWKAEIKDGLWRSRTAAECTPGPQPSEITISCKTDGTNFIVSYTGTLYQSEDSVNWMEVPNATSPYQVKMGNKKLFFCAKGESGDIVPGENITIFLPGNVAMEMIRIEPGTFMMGSPTDELGRYSFETQHGVILTKGYWLGKFEVTQAQYEAVMGKNPSNFKGADLPVERVSWYDATEFCKKLTEIEKEAGRLPDGYEYTLPTEAQWECACRAGTTTALNSGKNLSDAEECPEVDEVGWYQYNSDDKTHPVGQKQPNAWGLYDMHGNVCEWCKDWYGSYPSVAVTVTDPTGPDTPAIMDRIIRGGGWNTNASSCRSADRSMGSPAFSWNRCGFRVALAPIQ